MSYDPLQSPLSEDNMEARLWEYIDGLSDEATVVERLIQENIEWRAKYGILLDMHRLITATELEQPSLRFTKNVMEDIARYQIAPAAKTYINQKIIWGISAFFITMLAGFFIYGLLQINWSEVNNSASPIGIDLSAVDYSKMFNNDVLNGFMMVNILLGLLLLDRYLNKKRIAYRGGIK